MTGTPTPEAPKPEAQQPPPKKPWYKRFLQKTERLESGAVKQFGEAAGEALDER